MGYVPDNLMWIINKYYCVYDVWVMGSCDWVSMCRQLGCAIVSECVCVCVCDGVCIIYANTLRKLTK